MESLEQNNFKDATWYNKSEEHVISILGAGGIGSNVMYNLAKSLKSTLFIVDFDTVEEHNIGTQFFHPDDKGELKVYSLYNKLEHTAARIVVDDNNIMSFKNPAAYCAPITIAAFDNMEARKKAFEDWKTLGDRLLFIDGRLRATQYEVFCVTPDKEDRYKAFLFDSSEVLDEPCTFKQTCFAGMMIGARITSLVTNFLQNLEAKEDICSVPFYIKELLELCYMETKD